MKFKAFLAAPAWLGAAALVALLSPAPASAQVGGVSGRVLDQTGKPVANVDVVLDGPEGLPTLHLKTNARGEYVAAGVPIGDYRITATTSGMTARINRTHVSLGGPSQIPDLKLAAGTAAPA